jgi:hypothetical protein
MVSTSKLRENWAPEILCIVTLSESALDASAAERPPARQSQPQPAVPGSAAPALAAAMAFGPPTA